MRYLFVDDYRIAERRGFERRMNPARKQPEPVLIADRAWEVYAANPQVVYYPDEGQFRIWYYSMTAKLGLQGGYATSSDGINWEKPNLGLVDHDGSTENNLIESPGRVGNGLLYTPEMRLVEPADRLYKMLSWIRLDGKQRFVPLFSADGLRWKPGADLNEPQGIMGEGMGDTGSVTRTCDCFPLDDLNLPAKYVAFPRFHAKVGRFDRRAVGYSICQSVQAQRCFMEWTPPIPVLSPDFTDDQMADERLDAACEVLHYDHPEDRHCEFYGMIVHRYEELFLGFIWVFDVSMDMKRLGGWNQHGPLHIQLASSRDLIHWERLGERQPFIGLGEPDDWDSAIIHFNSYPILVGDEVRIYYSGTCSPHPMVNQQILAQWRREAELGLRIRPGAIGLATLPRDRFVSLDAAARDGYLRTRPFDLPAGQLHLNVDASHGKVLAMPCDASGKALWPWKQVEPISGDHLDIAVSWPSRDREELIGQRLSLAFRARNARLYSWWFG